MRRMILVPAALACLTCVLSFACQMKGAEKPEGEQSLAEQLPRIPPKSPVEALKTFATLDGFRMELIAAEPAVTDPVAMAYDENGRMYVVEMRGYPYPEEADEAPIGRVRLLEDKDDDGRYETSHVFVDGLSWPTGIALWNGGAFVIAAPDVWYFKDTDGDNKADVRKRIFTGFGKRNVQALPNNLKWGLDHKIYGATAANGGEIVPADNPKAKPISVRGRDFRFDPKTDEFEAISGTAQFGMSFDDWGDRFVCSNSNHAQQVVLPSRYLARNPYLPVSAVIAAIAKEGGASPVFRTSEAEPWRVVRTRRRAASGKKYAPTELVPIGFFTSATGITVYRGAAYPPKYHGNLFIGDVGGNLIHRKTLVPNGPIMLAERADQKKEFVTSTDNWFRPVNFVNAPDGTLHVLDMYRETIEHPWSIPEDIKSFLDLESGGDRGRIYRLSPPRFKASPPPRLGEASTDDLVRQLENPNGWWRDTAHRLLWERQDPTAVGPLRNLLANSKLPQGRMHALYSLAGLGSLEDAQIERGLSDASPRVRQHAVRLAESRLDDSPLLLAGVLRLAKDPDARLRMQVAFSLGQSKSSTAAAGLAAIAKRDLGDRWIRTAVLSSSVHIADRLLLDLLNEKSVVGSAAGRAMLGRLALVVGARNRPAEVEKVLAALAEIRDDQVARTVLVGLGDGLARSGSSLGRFISDPSSPAGKMLEGILTRATATARAKKSSSAARAQAIETLSFGKFGDVREPLDALLDAREPQRVQLAAVHALARFNTPDVAQILIDHWSQFTPAVRGEVSEALFSRGPWITKLLTAVEEQRVPPGQIDPSRKEALAKHPDSAIRNRAAALFGGAPADRTAVLEAYKPALSLDGDAERGEKVFRRECMTCHRIEKIGHEVGPNLATIRNRTPESLMAQIIAPSAEVLPNYTQYVVELDDGRLVTGLIAAESPTSITLKRAEGASDTILRQNIAAMTGTGKSLMPDGLEKKVNRQEMADLLAFLLNLQ